MRVVVCVLLVILFIAGCGGDGGGDVVADPGVVEWFDEVGLVNKLGHEIGLSESQVTDVIGRITVLATRSVPPVWGYAGMLVDLEAAGVIDDRADVDVIIDGWRDDPELAEAQFRIWNEARLEND